jgi:acyl-CoA synthetase (AMP-forming)/AMP-acid ligase II
MKGYFEPREATAAAVDADGRLHTGDLGSMDDLGYLGIEGRLRDVIIRGGENIHPREQAPPRPVQDAAGVAVPGRLSADDLRQDPEVRAA